MTRRETCGMIASHSDTLISRVGVTATGARMKDLCRTADQRTSVVDRPAGNIEKQNFPVDQLSDQIVSIKEC